MHNFAGMFHNENTTWNIDQIQHSLDIMSILLDSPKQVLIQKRGAAENTPNLPLILT